MSRKVLAVTVSLVMAFLMAACGPLGKPSVDEIVSHLQKSQEQQMHMHAHAIETFSFQPPKGASGAAGAPGKVVMEEWMDGPDKMRIEYKSGATSLPEPTKRSGFETKEIEVRGKRARLLERTGEVGSSVSWIEGNLMVTISGHVEGSEVVKIAKSLR